MADGTEQQVPDGSNADSPEGTTSSENLGAENASAENSTAGSVSAENLSAENSGSESPGSTYPSADPERVARIVAALRKAHAEQAAQVEPVAAAPTAHAELSTPAELTAETAETPDAPSPRRETTGVRSAKPKVPTLRWNPGARYRASRLANAPVPLAPAAQVPAAQGPAAQVPAGPGPVPLPPVPLPPVPLPPAPPTPAGPASGPAVASAPPALAGRLFRGPARRTGVFEREIWYPAARSSRVPRDVGEALVAAVERYRKGSISTSGLVRAIGRAHAA